MSTNNVPQWPANPLETPAFKPADIVIHNWDEIPAYLADRVLKVEGELGWNAPPHLSCITDRARKLKRELLRQWLNSPSVTEWLDKKVFPILNWHDDEIKDICPDAISQLDKFHDICCDNIQKLEEKQTEKQSDIKPHHIYLWASKAVFQRSKARKDEIIDAIKKRNALKRGGGVLPISQITKGDANDPTDSLSPDDFSARDSILHKRCLRPEEEAEMKDEAEWIERGLSELDLDIIDQKILAFKRNDCTDDEILTHLRINNGAQLRARNTVKNRFIRILEKLMGKTKVDEFLKMQRKNKETLKRMEENMKQSKKKTKETDSPEENNR